MVSLHLNLSQRRAGLASLVVLLAVVGLADAARAQSPFSLQNLGQRVTTEDARMTGRGGWGMAVNDSLDVGFKNVASLTSVRFITLKFSAYGEALNTEDEYGKTHNSRVFAPDIRIASPVIKDRLALTAGFHVFRSMQYHTRIDTSWGVVWADTVSGNKQFERAGNRFRVPLGGAFEVVPGVSLGATYNLEGGSLTETLSNFFTRPSTITGPLYTTNVKQTYYEYQGTSQTYALLLAPVSWLQAGASWTPGYTVDVKEDVVHFGVSQNYYSTYSMEMPDEYLVGFQIQPAGRWRLGADGRYQDFTKFTGPQDWMDQMQEEYVLYAGIERMGARVRRGGFSNLPLRFGYTVHQWAYSVGGEPVEERTYSIGTGFPFSGNLGAMDLALSYGKIGDRDKNGLETEVLRLSVSVTGLERWW